MVFQTAKTIPLRLVQESSGAERRVGGVDPNKDPSLRV